MDEEGRHQRFTSSILPPYTRRSPKVAEVLPILYLRGLPTGDFRSSSPYPVSSSPLKSGRVAPRKARPSASTMRPLISRMGSGPLRSPLRPSLLLVATAVEYTERAAPRRRAALRGAR